MSQLQTKPAFVQRFDAVRARMLRVQVGRGIFQALLLLVAGIALLAALDYWLELPRLARAAGLGVLGAAAAATVALWMLSSVLKWSRPRTAAEIEQHFPE